METLLIRGLDALSLTLTEYQQQQLLDFVAQLAKWNNVYNFTAITDHEDMVVKHC
jgi:16S rRNA (guanine527-N7)-methyltransferase